MKNRRNKSFFFFLILLISGFIFFPWEGLANSSTLRIGAQPKGFRLVIEGQTPIQTGIYQGNNNTSLLINVLSGVVLPYTGPKTPLISSIEVQSLGVNKTQIIINTKKPLLIKKKFALRPDGQNKSHRFVIDGEEASFEQISDPKAPGPHPQKADPPQTKKIIIIDAGHGGADPGTIGKNGTLEKNVTLKAAKTLASALKKTNRYIVKMTRNQDVFIPLTKRVQFSRENQGDLFISLHADSSPRTSARGLSVYTLSRVASDKEAARLAQKENKADLFMGINFDVEIPEVANILIDLTKRETMNLSISFAQMIKNILDKNILMPDNTHRFANFAVLRTPDIPAVLVELGFLSNPNDEALLNTQPHLGKIADKIVNAIDLYFWNTTK